MREKLKNVYLRESNDAYNTLFRPFIVGFDENDQVVKSPHTTYPYYNTINASDNYTTTTQSIATAGPSFSTLLPSTTFPLPTRHHQCKYKSTTTLNKLNTTLPLISLIHPLHKPTLRLDKIKLLRKSVQSTCQTQISSETECFI